MWGVRVRRQHYACSKTERCKSETASLIGQLYMRRGAFCFHLKIVVVYSLYFLQIKKSCHFRDIDIGDYGCGIV